MDSIPSKPVTFRPTEKTESIIEATMKAQNFEYASDAVNFLLERSQPQQPAQTEPAKVSETPTPKQTAITPFSQSPELESQQLPASLDRELQHFLNGRDSPLIALTLSDVPKKNPSLYAAAVALHDK